MWREKLNEAKLSKGVASKAIAEKAGLSEKTVSRILKGETMFPALDDVLAIASVLGISTKALFEETSSVIASEEMCELKKKYDEALEKIQRLEGEVSELKVELKHKSEIIELHDYYRKVIANKERP